jgi:hyperosmotically inducible periplasmic protein
MINITLNKKYRETLISGITALMIMVLILTLLIVSGYLFTTDMDDHIESTAKQSYVFKTYLKGDDIRIQAQDGIVILTGTVASEPHLLLAVKTVADLPGVKSVNNKLAVLGGILEKSIDKRLVGE